VTIKGLIKVIFYVPEDQSFIMGFLGKGLRWFSGWGTLIVHNMENFFAEFIK
jgi:hypothetical protein